MRVTIESAPPTVHEAERGAYASSPRYIGADLSGQDLSGRDFTGADLSRANLAGANLAGARFDGAILFEADLTDVEALGASFEGANLTGCRAAHASFGGARFAGADLDGADLQQASLTMAKAHGARLRGAKLGQARLGGADLTEADLDHADLTHADLAEARVAHASFTQARLHGAKVRGIVGFEDADWVGAQIRGVDFCGAYRLRRHIMDQNYLHEFRTESRGHAIVYWIWWATSDCGRSMTRWSAFTGLLVLLYAAIYSVVGVDFGDYPTPLSSIYFSVVTLTTLGYGDAVPTGVLGQLVVMSQAITGYVALGGLLSIFSSKMARRAE